MCTVCSYCVAINSNALGTAALGWMRYVVANSGALTGIAMSNTIATAHSIQNNDFQGIVHTTAGTNTQIYINNSTSTNYSKS